MFTSLRNRFPALSTLKESLQDKCYFMRIYEVEHLHPLRPVTTKHRTEFSPTAFYLDLINILRFSHPFRAACFQEYKLPQECKSFETKLGTRINIVNLQQEVTLVWTVSTSANRNLYSALFFEHQQNV